MVQPLLTIAIPTYNRENELKECLKSIEQQLSDDVEIIISDNASSDSTEKIVNEFSSRMQLRYYKNKKNIGPDANFHRCYTLASGEFILLLSDDDILQPSAIIKIIKIIKNNPKVTIMHLNTCVFIMDIQKMKYIYGKPRLSDLRDIILTDKNKFLELINIWITYCSGMVFRRDAFLSIVTPEQYFGTHFFQSHIFMNIMEKSDEFIVIGQPCIGVRNADNSNNYNFFIIWLSKYKDLIIGTGTKCGFNKKNIKKIYVNTLCNTVGNFLLAYRMRIGYKFELSDYIILFKCTIMYPKTWLHLYPKVIMPVKILSFLRKLKHW